MALAEIIKTATQFKDELSATFGAILQFLILGKKRKNKLTLIAFIILTTIFVLLFIVDPIVAYYEIKEPYTKVLYAFSGLFGIEIFSLIITLFPKITRHWIMSKLGVPNDD